MMIKVLGFWELGFNTPILEYDLWYFPLRDFSVDELIMCPVSGINKHVTEYNSFKEAVSHNKDLTLIYIDENGTIPLEEFQHPENVLYVLGRSSYSPMKSGEIDAPSVKIRTVNDGGRLWAHQAITIVLYDRMIKHDRYRNRY